MRLRLLTTAALAAVAAPLAAQDKGAAKEPAVYPLAVLSFEERGAGAKEYGPKVADLLFAKLAARPEVYLVDRADLKKVLEEQALNVSGAVKADEAVKVGQLTGAKLLVTGSVIQVDKKLFLVAKVTGTETSRVVGSSVEGRPTDELGPLVDRLADAVVDVVGKQADKLVPRPVPERDRVAAVAKALGKAARPAVLVEVTERHVGSPTIDPAAQTEVSKLAKETGFDVVDADSGGRGRADVLITGEGMSEAAGRVGGLVSVRARVELKAVDRRSGRVLAVDRQTALVVDLSEQVAAKTALQEAAAALAERVLPKLVTAEKKAQ